MRCNALLSLSLSIVVLMATALANVVGRQASKVGEMAPRNFVSLQGCMSDSQVTIAVRTMSFAKYEDQQKAVAALKADAERSSACRKQVITSVMGAMDQPNLDLTGGTPQFLLWHYGTQLLGDLKATEALDLLIGNISRHDGSGFPFNHYPAL